MRQLPPSGVLPVASASGSSTPSRASRFSASAVARDIPARYYGDSALIIDAPHGLPYLMLPCPVFLDLSYPESRIM